MPYVVESQPDGTYMVSCHWRMPITDLSQSEAHIIAWALNAMAEGKTLCGYRHAMEFENGTADWYFSPTDGAAPPVSTKPD